MYGNIHKRESNLARVTNTLILKGQGHHITKSTSSLWEGVKNLILQRTCFFKGHIFLIFFVNYEISGLVDKNLIFLTSSRGLIAFCRIALNKLLFSHNTYVCICKRSRQKLVIQAGGGHKANYFRSTF